MNMTGAELLIQLLEQCGVRIVAGIPGGALLPLYEALGRSKLIRHILARHEQAAGFMAQGMSRVTGKASVCFATSGPGVTNVITAIADAKLDSIPLVCIAGQVPTHLIGTDAFQEVPTIDMVRPITKACFFVRDASELPTIIPAAMRIATEGRPGPVLIDVPKDIQLQKVPAVTLVLALPSCVGQTQSLRSHAADYDIVAAMIATAERPLLYIGGGVVKSGAQEQLRQFIECTRIPVTTTLMALGTLDRNSPLNLGMLGMHGARYTNLAVDECDLLIAIGARFDDRATGRPDRFATHAKIIHVDIDAQELGKIKPATLAIHDDARTAIYALHSRVHSICPATWTRHLVDLRRAHPLLMPMHEQLCTPYGIIRAVGELAPADAIVATDVGQHQMWAAQAYPFRQTTRWLTSGGLGTMGFGLPAAIGAALAEPDSTVICFTGDGSLLMNIQELATLSELDLNVKIVLLDNAAYGLVKQQQELFYGRRLVASTFMQPSNFVAIARAFGIPACDLAHVDAAERLLTAAMRSPGPALIRVPIAASHHILPMVAPGAANVDAIDHAPQPHALNPHEKVATS
jgi:acetolactate synthase-1/2/3 large subunit